MEKHTARERMIAEHLLARGIKDPRVIDAFRRVPREDFMPPGFDAESYLDAPTPIGLGQTISQPFIVALTLEAMAIAPGARVLEIGTGSGYSAAVLSFLAEHVYTVERIESLASGAAERLTRLGYANVTVKCGDGTLGWAEHAPYDAIAVAAGGPTIPEPLLEQLAVGGHLVIPVGPEQSQVLTRVTRESATHFREHAITGVRFVPLIGAAGWPSPRTG
jgi:protein-L-isoaspartate(D-aspartate) O-methyltransferase